jgi:hypothetical protein
MQYIRPKPRPQNYWANNFDKISWPVVEPVKIKSNPRHDLERERLSASAQFDCEGCG